MKRARLRTSGLAFAAGAAFGMVAALAPRAAQAKPGAWRPDPPVSCAFCDDWNAPRAPFKVFGNTYFVGTAGLGAVLVTSDAGYVLLDGGLPQSAPLILEHIRALGIAPEKIRYIASSHAHYDHAGGIAAMKRLSGATVVASPATAAALKRGEPTADDPQFAFGAKANAFPAVRGVRAIGDGGSIRVGSLVVTAHHTPGHTPGSTSWSWRSCEGDRCLDVVYADSLNPVSAPGFRFTGDERTPSRVSAFERSIATVEALPCDVIIAVHPAFADLDGKLAARARNPDAFVDPNGCRAYAAGARKRLAERVAEETAASAAGAR